MSILLLFVNFSNIFNIVGWSKFFNMLNSFAKIGSSSKLVFAMRVNARNKPIFLCFTFQI